MGQLFIYVVYDHPKDFPEQVVVRRHEITAAGTVPEKEIFFQADTLQEVKTVIRGLGLTSLGRDVNDDPVILESFI
jgi:hypothetical protein